MGKKHKEAYQGRVNGEWYDGWRQRQSSTGSRLINLISVGETSAL